MKWAFPVGIIALSALASAVEARAPLSDPVALNIGINCQWQQRCMKSQTKAMKRALKYVEQTELPPWRLQMCNRNAGRQRLRVDWIGFDNCIRNPILRPIPAKAPARVTAKPARPTRKKSPRLTQAAPTSSAPRSAPGERG